MAWNLPLSAGSCTSTIFIIAVGVASYSKIHTSDSLSIPARTVVQGARGNDDQGGYAVERCIDQSQRAKGRTSTKKVSGAVSVSEQVNGWVIWYLSNRVRLGGVCSCRGTSIGEPRVVMNRWWSNVSPRDQELKSCCPR